MDIFRRVNKGDLLHRDEIRGFEVVLLKFPDETFMIIDLTDDPHAELILDKYDFPIDFEGKITGKLAYWNAEEL